MTRNRKRRRLCHSWWRERDCDRQRCARPRRKHRDVRRRSEPKRQYLSWGKLKFTTEPAESTRRGDPLPIIPDGHLHRSLVGAFVFAKRELSQDDNFFEMSFYVCALRFQRFGP